MIVIGDDRQVSPRVVKNEWTDEVSTLAPRVPAVGQLKCGSSLFDVFKVGILARGIEMHLIDQNQRRCRWLRQVMEAW